jgi:hypothetical protein
MNAVADPMTLKHRPDRQLASVDVDRMQPNMSPNVFAALQHAIGAYERPRIVETGIGISTYHLCEQIRTRGGTYLGVEHNRGWFEIVEAWIYKLLLRHAKQVRVEQSRVIGALEPAYQAKPLLFIDSIFRAGPLAITLLLRQAMTQTGDGTAEEFHEYLEAITGPVDVVIVDGRARVPTLTRLAERALIGPGGTLFIHDAKTYRDIAQDLFPGGDFLNGQGGFKNALRQDQPAKGFVPQEAYLWRAPLADLRFPTRRKQACISG